MIIFSFSYSEKRIFHNIDFKQALYITFKSLSIWAKKVLNTFSFLPDDFLCDSLCLRRQVVTLMAIIILCEKKTGDRLEPYN